MYSLAQTLRDFLGFRMRNALLRLSRVLGAP